MLIEIKEVQELTFEEKENIEGGIFGTVLACCALVGAAYKAGQAAGDLLWYATH
ncbi:class IIb bacteriocin, lactobin A/cerein 7B family [Flavobacterium sp. N502536]|uniref:class IIb bacteriocin, lactobin A/cerein 7B family n=1 Tax=Flavobacterium sp. N502536 TaxID=2986837 RepID=UPI002221F33F|nr:class IIb bacteriocin, lactobin A/cerein 7B family [Flavobacterium sp. N502536]